MMVIVRQLILRVFKDRIVKTLFNISFQSIQDSIYMVQIKLQKYITLVLIIKKSLSRCFQLVDLKTSRSIFQRGKMNFNHNSKFIWHIPIKISKLSHLTPKNNKDTLGEKFFLQLMLTYFGLILFGNIFLSFYMYKI